MITGDETEPGNLKRFWSFIKSKKCDNSGVAPLKRDGVAHSDSQVKANILNDQFSSVFTEEDTSTIPSLGHSTHPDLARISVSEEGVQKLLGGLKIHFAAGPDEIPARLLKEYASELAPALTLIFHHSIKVHYQPLGSMPGLYRSSRKGRELVHPTTGPYHWPA